MWSNILFNIRHSNGTIICMFVFFSTAVFDYRRVIMPVGSTGNHPKRFVSLLLSDQMFARIWKKQHHLYVDHLNHLFVGKCMDFDTYLNLPKGDPSKLQVVLRHFFEDHEPWINIKPIIDQLSGRTHPIHWQTCRYGPPLRKQHHYLAKNYMLIQKSGQNKMCVSRFEVCWLA